MAVFKGGPALPKRSDTMSSPSASTSPKTLGKREHYITPLLSNHDEAFASQFPLGTMASADLNVKREFRNSSTILGSDDDEEQDIKPKMHVVDGGDVVIPTSDMRSTSRNVNAALDVEMGSDVEERPRKSRKVAAADFIMPIKGEATTPTKRGSRGNAAAGSSKDAMKTPPKKQASAAPTTPRAAEPASNWSGETWNKLNFALLKMTHDHVSELYDICPELAPWRNKGRLLVKIRQLFKDALGGENASQRWDVEVKPTRGGKGSPKKD